MLHVTCHPSQTWDMSYCLPVFRGVKQLLLCCCHYVSIIYSLKLYCFRLVPLIYDVMMWALNMQDWLYFFWAYWASWVWAGHEDTDTWHEDTNLCRTCDILTRSLVHITFMTFLCFRLYCILLMWLVETFQQQATVIICIKAQIVMCVKWAGWTDTDISLHRQYRYV